MNIALLIIDMQKEFLNVEPCKEMLIDALDYINEVSQYFRKAKKPVIIVQDMEVGNGPGSKEYELVDELTTKDSDIYITKVHSNAFWQTDLENILKKLNVEFVVVCGFAAEHCALFTLNGAIERGFGASFLQNGLAGFSIERVKDTQALRAVISYQALKFILGTKD